VLTQPRRSRAQPVHRRHGTRETTLRGKKRLLGWNDKKKRRSGRGKKRLLGWNFNPALAAAALRAMSGFAATGFNSKATWFGS
jgi:hypothetical protein